MEKEVQTDIRVGTSGYSFQDWRETFYPADIKPGKMLDYYINYFRTVEINSTYYRIPHPIVMDKIVKKTPPGFDFMIKAPQSLTHQRMNIAGDAASFAEAIKPIVERGKLSGILAQFPFSFKCSQDGLDYLSICRDAVAPHPLFVEFRHNSWVNRPMYDRLKAEKIGYVCVDEPQLRGLLKPDFFTTTDIGYVRLHGRNANQWWDGGALRYDYNYSEEEMRQWRDKILKARSKMNKLYIFFNNCHRGQATKNAQEFLHLLDAVRG